MLHILLIFAFTCILVNAIPVTNNMIQLEKLSTLFVPYRYENASPLYKFLEPSVEQSAYDPDNKILYVVGGSIIHAIDIKDAENPIILDHRQEENVDFTDIEFCGGDIFVAVHNFSAPTNDKVLVYNSFSSERSMEIKNVFHVSTGPDMLQLTSDCKTVLVAIEGETYLYNGELVDPEGGIEIIKIYDNETSSKLLNFSHFNTRWAELEPQGLRFVLRENGNTFSNDVEPEYITFNKDQTKAYICLQENNAVAVVDLQSETIEEILPLGFKSWNVSKMDASDKDGGFNMTPWPVLGIYQPDAIKSFVVNGIEYLLTANEGDAKPIMDTSETSEDIRVEDILLSNNSVLMEWVQTHNLSSLQDPGLLGRLKVSNVMGKNSDGSFDKLYTFGGRGFSIRKLDTMQLIYDSGSLMEELHQTHFPDFFNSDVGEATDTISQTFDTRSDDKGPECESLETAYVDGRVVLFIACERPGSIAIFTIENDVTKPQFHSLWMGIEEKTGTWGDLYSRRKFSGLDPEDIRYISPANSPTGDHTLAVCGSVSGTISLFRINGLNKASTNQPDPSNLEMRIIHSTFLLIGALLLSSRFVL